MHILSTTAYIKCIYVLIIAGSSCSKHCKLKEVVSQGFGKSSGRQETRPQSHKKFFILNSTMDFFLLLNVKMQTFVGTLTFMSIKISILGLSEPVKS